jgi:hypothetical protein
VTRAADTCAPRYAAGTQQAFRAICDLRIICDFVTLAVTWTLADGSRRISRVGPRSALITAAIPPSTLATAPSIPTTAAVRGPSVGRASGGGGIMLGGTAIVTMMLPDPAS